MAGIFKPGIIAENNYQTVKFFTFGVRPGTSLALTADPWSYLFAILSNEIPNTRGANRKRTERALYYSKLAEGFYR